MSAHTPGPWVVSCGSIAGMSRAIDAESRVAEMERERDAAKADAARLREALERYGDHHPCCDYAERALYEDCACGFRAALASAPSAEPVDGEVTP